MKTKNTRLIYTDEKNLKVYESLPSDDFKEFFMTYLTYQDGDDVSKRISNPFVQTLFMAAYADKIAYNEEKWEKKAKTNRENGKKGGRPKKNNTDIQPNTEFDEEPKINPNKPLKIENDTDVPQERESPSEGQIDSKFNNIITNDDMGTFIGKVTGFEPAIEMRSSTSQPSMEELQRQTAEREKRKEEYAANFKKAFNIEVPEPTPQPKEVSFAAMSKCVPKIHMDIALKQVKKCLSIEENIMRLDSRLSSLLEGFSKEDRNRYYEYLIETHLK